MAEHRKPHSLNNLDDPAIGEWEALPGEVWRETEFLACALIRGDWETLSAHNFPLTDNMLFTDTDSTDTPAPPPPSPARVVSELRCLRCETWKPAHAFSRDSRKRSGRKSWCKACCKAAERTRWRRTKRSGSPSGPRPKRPKTP